MLRWVIFILLIALQVFTEPHGDPEATFVRAATKIVQKTNDQAELSKLITVVLHPKQSTQNVFDVLISHPDLQKAYFQSKNPVRYQMLPDVFVLASRDGQLSSAYLYRSILELPNLVYFDGHLNVETARHYIMDIYQFYESLAQILQNPRNWFYLNNGYALLDFMSRNLLEITKSPLAEEINTIVLPWVNTHPALLRSFISKPNLFQWVRPGGFEVLFNMACTQGAADVANFYFETPLLFKRLSKGTLVQGMSMAIAFGQKDVVKLFQSTFFVIHDFSQQDLAHLYILAFDDSKILDTLLFSWNLNQVTKKDTWGHVYAAAMNQHRADVQSRLLSVSRIRDALQSEQMHIQPQDQMEEGLVKLSYGQLVDRLKSAHLHGDTKLMDQLIHLIKAKEIALGLPHILHF